MVSIRVVFPLIFAGQICLGVGITTFFGYKYQKAALKETIFEITDPMVDTVDERLVEMLTVPEEVISIYSYHLRDNSIVFNPTFLKALDKPENVSKIRNSMWDIRNAMVKDFQSLIMATPQGQFMEIVKNAEDNYIWRFSDINQGGVLNTYQLDQQGNITELINSKNIDYDPRKRPYYQIAIEEKKGTWTAAYAGIGIDIDDIDDSFITFVKPIYDDQDNLLAVLASDVQLSDISQYLQRLKITKSSLIFIFNSRGNLIASSNLETVIKILKDGSKKWISMTESEDELTKNVAETIEERLGDFSIFPHTQLKETITIGNKSYLVCTHYITKDNLDWHIIFLIPIGELALVEYFKKNVIYSLIFITLMLGILAIIGGVVTARWFIRPVLTLSSVAHTISNHEYDNQPEIKKLQKDTDRKDELGQLAKIFARMIEEIKSHSVQLQAQIEQLRVDIDHQKKKDQVKEIIETDFFRDLKSRGKTLRQQRKAKTPKS